MHNSVLRYCFTLFWLGGPLAMAVEPAGVDFQRDIRPILSDKCFHCHGPDAASRQADLRLDDWESARSVLQAGQPDRSELWQRVNSADPDQIMPPAEENKPLEAAEVELLRRWIEQGAEWSGHWAYQPPRRWPIPEVDRSTWPLNWIDHFVLQQLEQRGWEPAPEADLTTLLRRLSFDLIGLPPAPRQLAEWEASTLDYEQLVEQLLGSPHYGERLATYWLDLVRYADTVGYHGDQDHSISPYRDWVIQAFNAGMPFDQMTREQLAGDLLPNPTVTQRIATGYNRLLQTTHEGGLQPAEYRTIYAADRVRNLGDVWLGATVGCAQCHDHKFDPYTMQDFYSLAAFFADIDDESHFKTGSNDLPTRRDPELELPTEEQAASLADLQARIMHCKAQLTEAVEAEQSTWRAQLKQLESQQAAVSKRIRRTMITVALPTPRTTRVLPRGNWMDNSGAETRPAFPEFLPKPNGQASDRAETARLTRLDLANWLVDAEAGVGLLTARVLVNRLWYLFMGNGLAADLSDFGGQGAAPSHPRLLDNLACHLVDSGWDIRSTIRLIVTSRTYRQSSRATAVTLQRDPNNRWYARQTAFRLPAEMIRDNALAVSGLLVTTVGGPSARPYQPAGYYRHLNFPTREYQADQTDSQWRRGVYVHWQRQFLHPMLRAFDATNREECTARRDRSNTPLAALTLLNDPSFVEAARGLAQCAWSNAELDSTATDQQRIGWLFRRVTSRTAAASEVNALELLLNDNRAQFAARPSAAEALLSVGLWPRSPWPEAVELAAWTEVCRALLNLGETTTRF